MVLLSFTRKYNGRDDVSPKHRRGECKYNKKNKIKNDDAYAMTF